MTKLTLKEMFDKSRELWSLSSQLRMLSEESLELALAVMKLDRHFRSRSFVSIASDKSRELIDHIAEEIADSQFMIEEILYYFEIVPLVAKHRKNKERRLEERIRDYE